MFYHIKIILNKKLNSFKMKNSKKLQCAPKKTAPNETHLS